jgi:hypothetical protein
MPRLLVVIMPNFFALKLRPLSACVAIIVCIAGCGEAVREDRTVEFSRDGAQVAFQHGDEGLYVANADGQGLTKIFQPDDSVLATSRPLSSPTDGRLIFTTAQPLEGEPPPTRSLDLVPAEGRIVFERPVRYTCWLRGESKNGNPPTVTKLFEAFCGHVGYIAAGLAVRWHPDGQHITYVASLESDKTEHTVFEFDIESNRSRRVFPYTSKAVICDWTPAGSHLVCVLSQQSQPKSAESNPQSTDGTWISRTKAQESWWQVPGSEQLSQGEFSSAIERLRASRPAWTSDDVRFAFVSQKRAADPNTKQAAVYQLCRAEFASKIVTPVTEADGPITDLHWSPDGKKLGYLQHAAAGPATLQIADVQGPITKLPINNSVRKFAGFDVTGKHLAYVVPSTLNRLAQSKHRALLLIPDPQARDSIRVANLDPLNVGEEVFSGMRVTFPLWSPKEEKLSLWLTFTPRYRSLISQLGPAGLRPGDPAATIDLNTRSVSWMAVTPQEELQVGHYFLLKGEPAEAWRWYAKAREKLPAAKPPADWNEFIRRMRSAENSQLFEALCLKRLGRDAEATAKWTEFEQTFDIPLPKPDAPAAQQPVFEIFSPMFRAEPELSKSLMHDFFVAEVLLSLDSLDEALAHFDKRPEMAESDAKAFSRAVVLAQLMLIAGDHHGYLAHCTDVVAPLAIKLWEIKKPEPSGDIYHTILQTIGGLCLTPLFDKDFVAELSRDAVQQHQARWKQVSTDQNVGMPALAVDLVLRSMASKLGDAAAVTETEQRIALNPATTEIFAGRPIDEVIASWFAMQNRIGDEIAPGLPVPAGK